MITLKSRLQYPGDYKIIILRPTVMSLFCSGTIAQGLQVINTVDTKVLKSNY